MNRIDVSEGLKRPALPCLVTFWVPLELMQVDGWII